MRRPGETPGLPTDLPTRSTKQILFRVIPALSYTTSENPSLLFTSGRPNRWNPKGVDCLYFSETKRTAEAEYDSYWSKTEARYQPKLVFSARVSLGAILDLEKGTTIESLGLNDEDLFGPWRLSKERTRAQTLGKRICAQQLPACAIRYPSMARFRGGHRGWNLAIFTAALRAGDSIDVLGPSQEPIESFRFE
jgi:RES domain-containing protein